VKLEKLLIYIFDKLNTVHNDFKSLYNGYEKDGEGYPFLAVLYNPTSIQYSKEIVWIDSGDRTNELRQKQYDMIKFKKLTMQLFFDFTMDSSKSFEDYFNFFELITTECIRFNKREDGGDSTRGDSSENKIYRPPTLYISWGKNKNKIPHALDGGVYIVVKIYWSYKMFDRDGNVLRATADITFEEIREDGMNEESNKERRVSAGHRMIANSMKKSLKG